MSRRWLSSSTYNDSIPSSSLLGPDSTTISEISTKLQIIKPTHSNPSPHPSTSNPTAITRQCMKYTQSVTIQAITSSIRHRTSNHIVNPSPYKQSHRQSVTARSPSSIRHHTGNHIVNPSPYKQSHRQSVAIQAITSSIRHHTQAIVYPSPYKQSYRQSVTVQAVTAIRFINLSPHYVTHYIQTIINNNDHHIDKTPTINLPTT